MRIATYNVNGVNGRLERLIEWLGEAQPDVVCLQELKAPQDKFPAAAIEKAGYGAIWQGQSRWNGVAMLAKGCEPVETRRRLPGEAEDEQARYIEAAVDGVLIGGMYAPNGNPIGTEKFAYKLRWLERLIAHAAELLEVDCPVVLTGDYNVIPEDKDAYKPERWTDDALFQPEPRELYRKLLALGWTDAIRHLHPDERIFTFWDYWRNAFARDAGIRIDHFLLNEQALPRLASAHVDKAARGKEGASDHAPTWIDLS